MFRKVFVGLLLLLLSACATVDVFDLSDPDHLEMEIDKDQEVNYGSTFQVSYYLVSKKNKRISIDGRFPVKVSGEGVEQVAPDRLKIVGHPDRFEDQTYTVQLSLRTEEGEILSETRISLNYRGNIRVASTGESGIPGTDGVKGGQTLVGRDGTNGRNGMNGADGKKGHNYTLHIWKEEKEIRVRMEDDSSGVVWKYRSIDGDSLILDISGGNGGKGGIGGIGGNGKDGRGEKEKLPGNGGQGGNGGNGGKGGAGGSVLIFVHPNAEALVDGIRVLASGGKGGEAGLPGQGGIAGKADEGQAPARHGIPGNSGVKGEQGLNGPKPTILVNSFDYKVLDKE